jgi:hypothetical protein
MVLSGVVLVIFDSRIVHRFFRNVKTCIRGRRREENVELGDTPSTPRVQCDEAPVEGSSLQVGSNREAPASLRNRQPGQLENTAGARLNDEAIQEPSPRVSAEHVIVPYSIWTGLVIVLFFLISFIIIMVLRGVLQNAPSLFEFFANMYLAGSSSCR